MSEPRGKHDQRHKNFIYADTRRHEKALHLNKLCENFFLPFCVLLQVLQFLTPRNRKSVFSALTQGTPL